MPLSELEQLKAYRAACLISAHDLAFWSVGENGEPVFCLFCSDIFAPAADCEEVDLSLAPMLWEIYKAEGWPGLVRWIAKRNNIKPMPKVQEQMDAYQHKVIVEGSDQTKTS